MNNKMVLIIGLVILLLGSGIGVYLVTQAGSQSPRIGVAEETTTLPTLVVGVPDGEGQPDGGPVSADYNGDGAINNADAEIWQGYLENNDLQGDLNGDGKVGALDFQELNSKMAR